MLAARTRVAGSNPVRVFDIRLRPSVLLVYTDLALSFPPRPPKPRILSNISSNRKETHKNTGGSAIKKTFFINASICDNTSLDWTYQGGCDGKHDGLGVTAADRFMKLQL
jgi:hypothetical protein